MGNCFRDKTIAVIGLSAIAIFSMYLVPEPDNIIINIVVAIAAFITGDIHGRNNIKPPPPTEQPKG